MRKTIIRKFPQVAQLPPPDSEFLEDDPEEYARRIAEVQSRRIPSFHSLDNHWCEDNAVRFIAPPRKYLYDEENTVYRD